MKISPKEYENIETKIKTFKIKYSQTGKKLLVELERVMKELKKKEIDHKSKDLYPEYDKLQEIYHGENKDAWQHSNYNRKFLKIS